MKIKGSKRREAQRKVVKEMNTEDKLFDLVSFERIKL